VNYSEVEMNEVEQDGEDEYSFPKENEDAGGSRLVPEWIFVLIIFHPWIKMGSLSYE